MTEQGISGGTTAPDDTREEADKVSPGGATRTDPKNTGGQQTGRDEDKMGGGAGGFGGQGGGSPTDA